MDLGEVGMGEVDMGEVDMGEVGMGEVGQKAGQVGQRGLGRQHGIGEVVVVGVGGIGLGNASPVGQVMDWRM